jgi:hypothetical protein
VNKARRHRAKAEWRRRRAERLAEQRYATTWRRLGELAERIDDRRVGILDPADEAEDYDEFHARCGYELDGAVGRPGYNEQA